MKHQLTLAYQLGEGALQPYLQGLCDGVANARMCTLCERVTFPPERSCTCQQKGNRPPAFGWKTLSGKATILHRTTGVDGDFALVRFAGADNLAVCRLADPRQQGDQVQLVAAGPQRPVLTVAVRAA